MKPHNNASRISNRNINSIIIPAATLLLSATMAMADITGEAQWTIASGGNGHTFRVVAKPNLISWDAANSEASLARRAISSRRIR